MAWRQTPLLATIMLACGAAAGCHHQCTSFAECGSCPAGLDAVQYHFTQTECAEACDPLGAPCASGQGCVSVALFPPDETGAAHWACLSIDSTAVGEGKPCNEAAGIPVCGPGLACLKAGDGYSTCLRVCDPGDPSACPEGTCVAWLSPYPFLCERPRAVGECCALGASDPPAPCADGNVCNHYLLGGCSTCIAAGGDRQPCRPDGTCEAGLTCYQTTGISGFHCTASDFGPPCCLPLGGEGQLCYVQPPLCDEGFVCVDATGAPQDNGDPYFMVGDLHCAAAGAAGEPCRTNGTCDADLACGRSPACGGDWDCCSVPGIEQAPCRPDNSCDAGLFCSTSSHCLGNAPCCVAPSTCASVGDACAGYPDFYCADPSPNVCSVDTRCCLPFNGGVERPCDGRTSCGTGAACIVAPAVTCPYGVGSCCQPAGASGEPCGGDGTCGTGVACVTQPAGTCPYGLDWCCAAAAPCGASDSCDAGFACVALGASACPGGLTKCCVPVGGLHEPCGAGQTCGAGLGCLAANVGTDTWCQNTTTCCLPAGGAARPCVPGTPPSCDTGLACIAASGTGACPDFPNATECCVTAGGLNQPCYANGTCDAPYACATDLACPAWLAQCCR